MMGAEGGNKKRKKRKKKTEKKKKKKKEIAHHDAPIESCGADGRWAGRCPATRAA
jgi:predicted nucleic acid binding AN1-type Zn finger protein